MNVQEMQLAMEGKLYPTPSQGIFDEFVLGSNIIDNVLDALVDFLKEYVKLPPKAMVLEAFESMLDAMLLKSTLGALTKRFVKSAALSAAGKLYDTVEQFLLQRTTSTTPDLEPSTTSSD